MPLFKPVRLHHGPLGNGLEERRSLSLVNLCDDPIPDLFLASCVCFNCGEGNLRPGCIFMASGGAEFTKETLRYLAGIKAKTCVSDYDDELFTVDARNHGPGNARYLEEKIGKDNQNISVINGLHMHIGCFIYQM